MPSSPQKKKNPKSIKHWPRSERPRERLFEQGVAALSDAELLAVFLRSGLPGQNVHELSLSLLQDFEGLRGLARRAPRELLNVIGLGPAKVATLMAAFEMGNRVAKPLGKERPVVASAQALFKLLRPRLCYEREEIFLGVLLNARNKVLKTVTFSRGDPTQIVISVPQVLRGLLREGCAAVVFVHNHPSGNPKPSKEDRLLTRRLLKACLALEITLHDHLIIGEKSYFSFAESGKL